MATPKKTTKPKAKVSSKAKPKSSSVTDVIKKAAKTAVIPGYGALSVAKKIDDYVQKKDPSLSKSKTYKAVKEPAKKVKGALDYVSDKAIGFAKGASDVISNPGKYIEKGAAKVGKLAAKGMKAVDDKIEKLDPSLAKSKLYGAVKGVAKKAPKAIETGVGIAGKGAAMFNPVTGSNVAGREVYKGGKAVAKYAVKKVKQGAKAIDDAIEKADPNLAKSKTYGAIKGTAKSALGVKSGSTAKKSGTKKAMAIDGAKQAMELRNKSKAKTTPAKTTSKAVPAKTTTTPAKTASPTVSQLWQQKTGTSWSEAKKQGLTDGSAKSNIALMKKLQSGSVNKNTVKADSAKKTFDKEMNQNIQDELSGKTSYEAPTPASKGTADKAADENKMRRGGMVRRRMQAGGAMKTIKKAVKSAIKSTPEYQAYKITGKLAKNVDDQLQKRYPNYTGKGSAYNTVKKGVKAALGYKTGGMVNSNSKVSAIKSAGSKGVKVGANTRATAARAAKGRVGGISKAPRTATPKARMGMSVRRRR